MAHIEFDVKTWRNYYDQVNILGLYLKDSQPDADGNPPKFRISLEERRQVELDIDELLKNCGSYLDKCNMRPNESLWNYDRFNRTTWASDEKFAYRHLVSRNKYLTLPEW